MKSFYRPEIDGLRAIAVISVIIYHAKISIFGSNILKGGFLGVDIFFVISGYLITSIIYKEIKLTNNFSFVNFYARRIRRIIPALFFVILFSMPFAWKLILPLDLVNFSKSLLSSMGFISNYFFYTAGQEYISKDSLYAPLLHTWSLSVEEQYYIIFPLFFFIFFKFFKNGIFVLLISIFCVSFFYANIGSEYFPSLNFYSLLSRLWEIMAGAIIAILYLNTNMKKTPEKLKNVFMLIGILLIFFPIIFYDNTIRHPSILTLPIIIGTCIIIWYSSKDNIVTKILSSKPLVSIGLISYSLYLWHYPIFAFSRIKFTGFISETYYKEIIIFLLLIALSLFTYFFIEKPFRNKKNSFKFTIYPIAFFSVIFIIFSTTVIINNGFDNRFYSDEKYKLSSSSYNQDFDYLNDYYNNDYYKNHKIHVLIVGNSHAINLLNILINTDLKKDYYFNIPGPKLRGSNTPGSKQRLGNNYQVKYFYDFLKEGKAIIDGPHENFLKHLKKQYRKSEIIILHSLWSETDVSLIEDINSILVKDNKKLIVIDNSLYSTVKLSYMFNRLDYFVYMNKRLPNTNELINIEKELFNDIANKNELNVKIYDLAKKNNIKILKMENINCNIVEKRCPVITKNGYKIYWDYGHLTNAGAKFFSEIIQKNEEFLKLLK